MRRIVTATLLVLPLSMAAACAGVGSGSDDEPKASGQGGQGYAGDPSGALNIMGFGGEDEVGQSRIAAFKASAPGVTVRQNKGEFDAQQFLTALASGNPPDLVYMNRNLIGTYAAKGALQPLTDCIEGRKIDTGQYRPAALQTTKYKDAVYGIPEFTIVTVNR